MATTNFLRVWVMGDIHGSILPIENFIQRNKDFFTFSPETDCIILLGDVGANYFLNNRDDKFKKKLNNFPFTFFCIRGNHESRIADVVKSNPNNWNIEIFWGNFVYTEDKYPNIKYAIDRPAIYDIKENEITYRTLIIPGAYSVDKYYRLEKGWRWFENEQLTQEEMEKGRELCKKCNNKFDIVLSHTCPICYEPTDLFFSMVNQSMVDKTMERYLGEIEFRIDYKLWLWGHYHSYRRYPMNEEDKLRVMLSAGEEVVKLNDLMANNRKTRESIY